MIFAHNQDRIEAMRENELQEKLDLEAFGSNFAVVETSVFFPKTIEKAIAWVVTHGQRQDNCRVM